MKCLLIFSLALCCTPAFTKTADSRHPTPIDLEFQKFVETYSKEYANSVEEAYRKKIFADNFEQIRKHNVLYYTRKSSFVMGVNQYSDLLNSEFMELKTGFRGKPNPAGEIKPLSSTSKAPESLDWREKGAVTQVKNQWNCGSCWSFSATGAIEAQHFLNTSQLVEMSEQNLIDCAYGDKYNTYGCEGGFMTGAFDYVIDNKGISMESKYPYEATNGDCRYSPDKVGATIAGYKNLTFGDENALKLAVAEIGPVSVGIDASGIQMQHYKNGLFYQKDCSPMNLNHGVLVVGYGKIGDNNEYWLVKNSWGADWGDKGYVKMARNRNNHCGIASMASVPYNT